MSFNIVCMNMTPTKAGESIKAQNGPDQIPDQIKEYVMVGLLALKKRYGDGVKVNVTCYGHLHDGVEGNSPVTSATIEVRAVGFTQGSAK